MATLEQVEKLKARANVTFEEARDALNACNGDLLDALIMLERQGKAAAPNNGGFYSSTPSELVPCPEQKKKQGKQQYNYHGNDEWKTFGASFKEFLGKVGQFLLKIIGIGNNNFVEVWRNGGMIFSIPVTVFVLLMIFMFWSIIPLMVVGLFFKFRYRFNGAELGNDLINNAMDGAADAADAAAESIRNAANNANPHSKKADDAQDADWEQR